MTQLFPLWGTHDGCQMFLPHPTPCLSAAFSISDHPCRCQCGLYLLIEKHWTFKFLLHTSLSCLKTPSKYHHIGIILLAIHGVCLMIKGIYLGVNSQPELRSWLWNPGGVGHGPMGFSGEFCLDQHQHPRPRGSEEKRAHIRTCIPGLKGPWWPWPRGRSPAATCCLTRVGASGQGTNSHPRQAANSLCC